jgi:predicted CopG family antitoxin
MEEKQSRKNLKLTAEAYNRAAELKNDGETWSKFIRRMVEQGESGTLQEASPEQTREAVREVIREESTRDLLSVEIESVIENRITDDIESVIRENPPKEAIREATADILHSEGVTSSGPLPVDRDAHDDLVSVVEAASSREWVNNYLDMVAELIGITGVTEDDDQLVMSIRTDQDSLPISLGNRYCLKGYLADQKLMVILPHGSVAVDELEEKACKTGQFSGGEDPPHWYTFPAASADEVGMGEYHEDWKQALRAERERGHLRTRGDAHKPAVYRAATDSAYRQRLLNDAGLNSYRAENN